MVNVEAYGYSPGHITGFFEPFYHKTDVFRTGSRGAGVNLTLGSISKVSVTESKKQVFEIFVNSKSYDFKVIRAALGFLLGSTPVHIKVETRLGLPLGQGFGMSASATLSSTLALTKVTDFSYTDALRASHFAEVRLGTGLGDVIASSFGGFEIRKKPGLPPWGIVEHIPGQGDLVLCVVGRRLDTKKVLSDSSKAKKIFDEGKNCTDKILDNPHVESFFSLSDSFARNTGLASGKVLKAMDAAKEYGLVSMSMLGNSVFAWGETEKLCKVLSNFGRVFVCRVDPFGARVIEGVESKKI